MKDINNSQFTDVSLFGFLDKISENINVYSKDKYRSRKIPFLFVRMFLSIFERRHTYRRYDNL